jgi:hypothetical protein
MINRDLVCIEDFPKIGGQNATAYGNVMMPGKLYGTKNNIQTFIESKMVDDWNVTVKWMAWLKEEDLKTVIEKEQVQSLIHEELEQQKKAVDNMDCCRFRSAL